VKLTAGIRRERASPWARSLAALLFAGACQTAAAGSTFRTPEITAGDLAERLTSADAPLVIDVRKPVEFSAAHVPGAVNIPHTELEMHVDELDASKGIVVYCIVGRRTRDAERVLLDNGIDNVYHLKGGLGSWLGGGRQVEKGKGRSL